MSEAEFKRGQAMTAQDVQDQILIEKIRSLPPEKIAEVEDFVDFLHTLTEYRFLTIMEEGRRD